MLGSEEVAAKFPPAFVSFLRENDIHPDNYSVSDVPRYIRISPRAPSTVDRQELVRQLGASVDPVPWLEGYYQVPSHVKIAGCDAYKKGYLYGIDVSSGAAVAALAARPGEHVLDLCCAPGAKLCALADAMDLSGTLTGVDVSAERLASCRTLCTKYGIHNARLWLLDGREFTAPPPVRRVGIAARDPRAGASAAGAAAGTQPLGMEDMTPVGAQEDVTPVGAQEDAQPASLLGGHAQGQRSSGIGQDSGSTGMGEDSRAAEGTQDTSKSEGAELAAGSDDGRGRRGHDGHASRAHESMGAHSADSCVRDRTTRKRRRQADVAAEFYVGRHLSPLLHGGEGCEGADGAELGAHLGYDKVLVDAECTHDGSIKHLAKFAHWGWETFERRFLDPARLNDLARLQADLIRVGFRALRPGGTMVYSTCSFAKAQNEAVVSALLREEHSAQLVPIEALAGAPCREGALPHTLRFEPRLSATSGLFIARIRRRF